jgi:hypothetical protein
LGPPGMSDGPFRAPSSPPEMPMPTNMMPCHRRRRAGTHMQAGMAQVRYRGKAGHGMSVEAAVERHHHAMTDRWARCCNQDPRAWHAAGPSPPTNYSLNISPPTLGSRSWDLRMELGNHSFPPSISTSPACGVSYFPPPTQESGSE